MMPAKSRQKDQDSVALVKNTQFQVAFFLLKKKSIFILFGLASSTHLIFRRKTKCHIAAMIVDVDVDATPTCEAIEENFILEYTPSVTSVDTLNIDKDFIFSTFMEQRKHTFEFKYIKNLNISFYSFLFPIVSCSFDSFSD